MKRIILGILLIVIIAGCANNNSESNVYSIPDIDKEFVENKAEIGLNKEEVKDIFGEEYISGNVDSSDIWFYDGVKDNYEYDPRLEAVSHEEIKSDNVKYQLYINFNDDETFRYSYFYKGNDGKVWQFSLNPDGTATEEAVSN
ncbi:PhoU family transcriptional regulator [Alkalibacillus aidingensis]|uniref:PhoU family transcriptional regulator n=1 Tax=Alkalibacillus aidingensis TaxID=2747607 RepID=UPI0016604ACD|nr:PhoU family transcriptional regulator [Alkalibacillus aidingensis]